MPTVDIVVESKIEKTTRVKQLSAMFDCPAEDKSRLTWKLDLPIDAGDWNVGLIVGPSGSGKSTIMRDVWGDMQEIEWGRGSVVDDFETGRSMEDISAVCQAVGFNTIPAWMRPYAVLSNGEKFRVDIARRMLELPDPIVVDEFTSVVDRQVAQIGSHAVQKYVRRNKRQFVAVTCHYDVIDWLQPDWVLDMATRSFTRRCLQRRPALDIAIGRLPYSAWSLFAPFHYLTANLHRSAKCFGLWVGGRLAAFCGVLHRPHPKTKNIKAISRIVTLPDWQGLGLAFVLAESLAAAYKVCGFRFRNYPAHPSYIRAHDRSPKWACVKKPGYTQSNSTRSSGTSTVGGMGDRPSAVFEWVGPASDDAAASRALLGLR